ncbi:MAG TPA: hypothetical protein VK498_05715 [Ferruginibacter sp.]|nr:hypothetical protein [Ferruginibacter sp.]
MLDILYKYFNWSDLGSRKILTEQEIYFCNAKKWKNYGEFDFTFKDINPESLRKEIKYNVERMQWENPKQHEKWFNVHLHKYKIDFSKYSTLQPVEKDLYEAEVQEKIIDRRVGDIINNPEIYERNTRTFYFTRTGIFSTSLSKESSQLWGWKQNYNGTKNGNAICIGLDFDKLKTILDTVGNYTLGSVNYQGKQNEVDFIGTGNTFLINRLNSITYTLPEDAVENIEEQQEVRILKFLTNDTSDKSTERFLKLKYDCIKEIIIHSNTSNDTQDEIRQIAKVIGCANLEYSKL